LLLNFRKKIILKEYYSFEFLLIQLLGGLQMNTKESSNLYRRKIHILTNGAKHTKSHSNRRELNGI